MQQKKKITTSSRIVAGVYCWKNKTNGKLYIGSSCDVFLRFKSHLANESSNKNLQKAFNVEGLLNFEYTILEFIPHMSDREDTNKTLKEKEQYYLNLLLKANESNNVFYELGYNECRLSDSPEGRLVSEDARERMSEAGKTKIITQEHKDNISKGHASKKEGWVSPNSGKKNTAEHINKVLNTKKLNANTILQYDLLGNFIRDFKGAIEAENLLNNGKPTGNVSKCCSGVLKKYKGFMWRIKVTDEVPLKIKPYTLCGYRINIYNDKLDLIDTVLSFLAASKITGVARGTIKKLTGTGKYLNGYLFEYDEE